MANRSAQAWDVLARHLELSARLPEERQLEVEASTIKRVTGWEPRLLMKMDSRSQRPPVLSRLQAMVLPVRNGRYAIVASDGYHDVEEPPACRSFHLSEGARGLRTLPWDTIPTSESQALDMALASGMLHDFLRESQLTLTIRGRLRSPAFSFQCRGARGPIDLSAEGVQIEVDAGLEGESIHLVEAKLGKRSDFHLRQLYYPFRMWSLRVQDKPVYAVFCAYHDRQFSFWKYTFGPPENYHGVQLLESAVYSLDPEVSPPAWRPIVRDGLQSSPTTPPEVPFPQADSLERVIDLVEAAAQNETLLYGFSDRQAGYYLNAARYLGLVEPQGNHLTAAGRTFLESQRHARHILILQAMVARPVWREALRSMEQSGELPASGAIQEWISLHTRLGEATLRRRAQTVLSWLRWVRAHFLDALFCP